MQAVLFGNEVPKVRVQKDIAFTFNPEFYPAKKFYEGSVQFGKHFYEKIGDMNKEEIFCAQQTDCNSKVETWIRNVEHDPEYSFWLPTHKDKFYPDFVIKLTDGTFAAVEYKGEHLSQNPDSLEKKTVGEIWAEKSNGFCKFIMPTKKDGRGRDLSKQIHEFFT